MATLDIRSTHDNIDAIIIHDDDIGDYAVTRMMKHGFGRKGFPTFVFDMDSECTAISKERAENLIKALQYAIDNGWWGEEIIDD